MARSTSLRSASLWSYVLAFGALFGYATYGDTVQTPSGPDTNELWLWVAMALIGAALLVRRDRRIGDRGLRARVSLGDAVVLAAALLLIIALPSVIGVLRGLVLLALFVPYALWCFRALDAAGEW